MTDPGKSPSYEVPNFPYVLAHQFSPYIHVLSVYCYLFLTNTISRTSTSHQPTSQQLFVSIECTWDLRKYNFDFTSSLEVILNLIVFTCKRENNVVSLTSILTALVFLSFGNRRRTPQPALNMKRAHPSSAKISYSTSSKEESTTRKPWQPWFPGFAGMCSMSFQMSLVLKWTSLWAWSLKDPLVRQ